MKIAELNYSSVNKLVQKAADNYIEDEAPVWIEAAKKAQQQLKPRRKPVGSLGTDSLSALSNHKKN